MGIGDSYPLTGQVRVSDAEAREHELEVNAKRVIVLPNNQQVRVEYDSSSNAIYVGVAPKGLATFSDGWLLKEITYSGSDPTIIKIAYGNWDNRASESYS